MMELRGTTAVITGAASGIGRALAAAAAARGMALALCDSNAAGLEAAALEISAKGGTVFAERADVSDPAAMKAFARRIGGAAAAVSLVFANAGVLRAGPWWRQPVGEVALTFDVNVMGAVHTVRAFLPAMVEAGGPGRIVFTGSVGSLLAAPGLGAYAASKHAVWALAETLHHDLKRDAPAIGVSLLCPGAVQTALLDRPDAGPGAGMQARLKARMDEAGISPETIAQTTFEAIDEGRFWIFPQPQFKAAAETRFQRLLAEQEPTTAR